MSNHILFVFEGERPEKQIYNNLSKYFINENSAIICVYCAEIYQLYKEISRDEFLDVFLLLKEIPQNKESLNKYKSSDFSEIYLFFDYDGHATSADDTKLIALLETFYEETTFGKLYLSYPMAEALKHFSKDIDFKSLTVDAKNNIRYKNKVNEEAGNIYKQITTYDLSIWCFLIDLHVKKMNFLVKDSFSWPEVNHSQKEIFYYQLNKHISIDNKVAVLSAFPIFLLDYYGVNILKQKINKL